MTLHEFYVDDTTFSFKVDVFINRVQVNYINKFSLVFKTQENPIALIERDVFADEEERRLPRTKVSIVPLVRWGFTYDTVSGRYSVNFDEVPLTTITEYWLDDRRPKS